MFQKQNQVIRDLMMAIDIIGLELIWLLSYYLRFHWGPIPVIFSRIVPLGNYTWIFIFFPFIWIFAGLESDLYLMIIPRTKQLARIFRSLIVSMLLIITISFLLKRFEYSRLVFVYFALLAFLFLATNRLGWNRLLRLLSQSKFAKRTILIDSGTGLGSKLAQKIASNPEMGLNLLGWVPCPDSTENSAFPDLPRFGEYHNLNQTIKIHHIQCVLICCQLSSGKGLEKIFEELGKYPVDIVLVPDLQKFFILDQKAESFDGFSFFHLQTTRLPGWNAISKRVFDLIGALILLVLLSPLLIAIGILVKLTSRGPMFYYQTRLGADEKEFKIIKFRSMVQNAEAQSGPALAVKDDPRTTRIGKILRKTSLDELPNLFNVLKGEMSLVGPRPEREYFVEKFTESNPLFALRLKVKPGMTGWAQVNGWRGDSSIAKRYEYDIYYIQNWSFALDLKILFMTPWKGIYNPHA